MITRTDKELKKLGYCIPVFRAVEYAGGPVKVAQHFGYKTRETVKHWYRTKTRKIPSDCIKPLCDMGGNKVTPDEILNALECKRAA